MRNGQRIFSFRPAKGAEPVRRDQRGMTLVEVICALALFAIVSVFILNTLMVGANLLAAAKNKTRASMKAAGAVAQATASSGASASSGAMLATSSGAFTVTFSTPSGSVTVSMPGRFVTGGASGADPGDGVSYSTFVAGQ